MTVVARVEQLVTEFVDKVAALARREAALVLSQTLVETVHARPRRQPGPPPSQPTQARVKSRPKGAKRSADELQALRDLLIRYVKHHPGERIEQIARGLGMPTHDLKRPVRLLVDAGHFTTEGVRRGTCYYAA